MSAATRRHLLTTAIGAIALTSCSLTESPPPARRPPLRAKVVAPPSLGRPGRANAWNRRYGEDLGVLLEVESPPETPLGQVPNPTAQLQAAGGDQHILWTPHEAIPDLAFRGALKPLDDLVKRNRVDLKAFMPCTLQTAYGLDSHLYALPEQVDAGQLYFNRQHLLDAGIDFRRAGLDFERPSSNWETLRRASLDLLLGRSGRDRLPWHPGAAPLEVWGWANGGSWLSPDGRQATFSRPENVAALEWLVAQAAEVGGSRLSPADQLPDVATSGSDLDRVAGHPFLDGRVSLWFDSGRFMSTLVWNRPDFPIGYVESPRRTATSPLVTWARSSGYALTSRAPDVLFPALRFLVSEDAAILDAALEATQAPIAGAGSLRPPAAPQPGQRLWFPPFTGQLRADRFLASRYRTEAKIVDEGRDHALEQLRHARSRERCTAPNRVWPLLRRAHLDALRGTPPQEALQSAQGEAQAILDAARRGTR